GASASGPSARAGRRRSVAGAPHTVSTACQTPCGSSVPATAWSPQAKSVVGVDAETRRPLDDIRFPCRRARHEQALFLELARDGDDLLLVLLDVAQANRTEQLDLLPD